MDTSVLVDYDLVEPERLPDESAIAAITLAGLSARPHATSDEKEKARRQDRLQWVTATWDPLPFDAEAARMYGLVFAAMKAIGRTSRTRVADLLIVSNAAANSLPLYTRNAVDFIGLEGIVEVVGI